MGDIEFQIHINYCQCVRSFFSILISEAPCLLSPCMTCSFTMFEVIKILCECSAHQRFPVGIFDVHENTCAVTFSHICDTENVKKRKKSKMFTALSITHKHQMAIYQNKYTWLSLFFLEIYDINYPSMSFLGFYIYVISALKVF